MADTRAQIINGVAYVLPASEARILFVKRFGPLGVGMNVRWSSFGIGVDVLKAGVLVMVGPVFIWLAHVDKQIAAFERQSA